MLLLWILQNGNYSVEPRKKQMTYMKEIGDLLNIAGQDVKYLVLIMTIA